MWRDGVDAGHDKLKRARVSSEEEAIVLPESIQKSFFNEETCS
jgi:hypothetical protein